MSWNPLHLPDQTGKVFVVTGGNAGIGYFISEQLAAAGARVIVAGRSPEKVNAALASIRAQVRAADVDSVHLDLANLASVRRAADQLERLPRLDGLIENAGIMPTVRTRQQTADGHEAMFGTNHLGHFALTALVFPALARTPRSRVVTMGSVITRFFGVDLADLQSEKNYARWAAYAQSKHATESFGFELDRRLRATHSEVMSLVAHPGGGLDGTAPFRAGVNEPSWSQRLVHSLQFFMSQGKHKAAWPVVRAAVDPEAQGGQYWGPRFGSIGKPALVQATAASLDESIARSLWDQSEVYTGVRFALPRPTPARTAPRTSTLA